MNIVSRNEVLFVIWSVDGIDCSHVFTWESCLINGLKCILNLLKFGHIQVFSCWLGYFFETFLVKFPYFDISLIWSDEFLVLSLSPEPMHVSDCLRDLLTFKGIKLATVRLKLSIVFNGVLLFSRWFLDLEYDDTSSMISESEIFSSFIKWYFGDDIFLLNFFAWSFIAEHLGKFIISCSAVSFGCHNSFFYLI